MNATEEADRGTVPEGWLNAQEQPKVYTKDPYKTWDRWYKEALRRGNKWAHNMVCINKFNCTDGQTHSGLRFCVPVAMTCNLSYAL